MTESPSPRKAWIETATVGAHSHVRSGRLPPGRRGLKRPPRAGLYWMEVSPSPRKAWIETKRELPHCAATGVAFPPEGVD